MMLHRLCSFDRVAALIKSASAPQIGLSINGLPDVG